MVEDMREITTMIRNKDLEHLHGPMAESTLVDGWTVNNMDLENTSPKQENSGMENGKKERE